VIAAWTVVADRTRIGAGTAVLDVGCGSGGFCELAAARGARVHGLDADAGEIERARRRVPAGDFRVGLMEDLPWPDDRFDVVTGFNAFQYALDVDVALAEARRVARPGAPIAICKWGRPQDNELFALLGGGSAPRPPAAGDPIDDAVGRAGLPVVDSGDVPVALELPDDAALTAALAAADAPATLATAERFRRPDGSYRFNNRLRYLILRVN
jgi:SAM-dependent methyltransferase